MENVGKPNAVCVALIVLYALFSYSKCQENTKVIATRAGTFKGVVRELDVFGNRRKVEKILGVPYAETPRRFRKSVIRAPMTKDSVYDATKFRAACPQLDIPLGGVRQPGIRVERSEDCLFLNIVKPSDRSTSKGLSVMVWFHGGGFIRGCPQTLSYDILSAFGDIIIVGVTYRMALWGFLSTGDNTLPGNLGLWDQHVALQWVHENIEDFGGDPHDVAILGHSAGSSSIVYQSMFPANKGFFQRAIGFSGSITCPWSFQPNPRDIFIRFGDLANCDSKLPDKEIVECLESKSNEELHAALNKKENGYVKFPMEMVSVIDNMFLHSNPYNVIQHSSNLSPEAKELFASIDFMTGLTSEEGGMNVSPFVGVYDTENFAPSREEFEKTIIPRVAKLMYGEDVPDFVYDMIIHEYTNWTNPNDIASIRKSFLQMTGDYVFNFHAKLVADMHANLSSRSTAKTFAYWFEAFPSQRILWTPTWITKPNHGDELTFLFGYDKEFSWTTPYSDDYKPPDWELKLSQLFMTLITNFVKSG